MFINTNNKIPKFTFFYLIVFISLSIPYAYMQTFLDYVGYDVVERGYILSGSAIVAIIGQFVTGYICDRYKTDKKPFNVLIILMAISTVTMYYITEELFYFHLIFISLMSGLFRTVLAVQDTWTLEVDDNCKNNYGFIRAFGAIGWMIGSLAGGVLLETYGYNMLGYIFGVLTIITVLYTKFIPDAFKVETEDNITFKDVVNLFKSRRYFLIVMIFLFINIVATADMYTTVDKMLELNAGESVIGLRWSIQAFVELPLFFLGGYLLKKFGDYKLMLFGTLMYVIRFILYSIANTPELMIMVTCLQFCTYPLIMITSKTLIDSVTPIELRASGQNIASSIYIGLPLLITPILAGYIISFTSINMALLTFGLIGIIPLIMGGYIYIKEIEGA